MVAVIGFLVTYVIPAVSLAVAGWKTYTHSRAVKKLGVFEAAMDVVTTAIEPGSDPEVKADIARLAKGTGVDVGRVIDDSIGRLDLHKIKAMIESRKVREK